jgi:hypothetical protein
MRQQTKNCVLILGCAMSSGFLLYDRVLAA